MKHDNAKDRLKTIEALRKMGLYNEFAFASTMEALHELYWAMRTEANAVLCHALIEEFAANGNSFASPDTDFIIRQAFAEDWKNGNETNKQILERLINEQ